MVDMVETHKCDIILLNPNIISHIMIARNP